VTEAFEQQHPEIVARIVKAHVKAAHWSSLEANREALFAIWARSGYPEASFRFDNEGQALKFRNTVLLDEFFIDQYRIKAEQARGFKLLKREVDIPGWFEPRYLNAALKDLHLEGFWTPRD
jgi:sulfonate transport system substrate-binding protein